MDLSVDMIACRRFLGKRPDLSMTFAGVLLATAVLLINSLFAGTLCPCTVANMTFSRGRMIGWTTAGITPVILVSVLPFLDNSRSNVPHFAWVVSAIVGTICGVLGVYKMCQSRDLASMAGGVLLETIAIVGFAFVFGFFAFSSLIFAHFCIRCCLLSLAADRAEYQEIFNDVVEESRGIGG